MTILLKDSLIPHLLDNFYAYLQLRASGIKLGEALALGNTITPFDIDKLTPFYNEALFGIYADRVVTSEGIDDGAINAADRYSKHYENVVLGLSDQIDQRHPEIIPKITELRIAVKKLQGEIAAAKIDAVKNWTTFSQGAGFKPEDPDYELKYLKHMEDIHYFEQIKELSESLDHYFSRIDQVRRALYTSIERPVIQSLHYLRWALKLVRPKRPQQERTSNPAMTELTLANPDTRVESLYHITPSILPVGDLIAFLSGESTNLFEVSSLDQKNDKRVNDWGVNGGANFGFFSIGGGGGGGGTHYDSMKAVRKVSVNFKHIADYLVERDLWFNPAILENTQLSAKMIDIPGYEQLGNVITSLIICRGMAITLQSDQEFKTEDWSEQRINGSGGITVFGFSFGGGGGGVQTTFTTTLSEDKKSLLISDAATVCRVLGRRTAKVALNTKQPVKEPLIGVSEKTLSDYDNGKITYINMMSNRFFS